MEKKKTKTEKRIFPKDRYEIFKDPKTGEVLRNPKTGKPFKVRVRVD